MKDQTNTPAIIAGLFGDVAWIRVQGKGSFQNSPQLRAFADHMVSMGQTHLVVDLEECPVMDSTFMGTLTGIALILQGHTGSHLQLINANSRNTDLVRSLGLDQILDLDISGDSWTEERELVRHNVTQAVSATPMDRAEHKEHVLHAHEALCQANAENESRFSDVLEYLKQDVAETREAKAEDS
ncbi:MAG: STAS domain-containing protein [Verrucomicrobiota bacterium]